jgi:predicted Rdx family selenoprotein
VRAALQDRGIGDIELQPGRSGQFDILVDGGLEYSRHATGRFPSEDDIAKLTG